MIEMPSPEIWKVIPEAKFYKICEWSVGRTVPQNKFSDLTHSLSKRSKNIKFRNFFYNATEGKRHIVWTKVYPQNTELGKITSIGLITKRNSILKQQDIFSGEGERVVSGETIRRLAAKEWF